MRIKTKMPANLKVHYERELELYFAYLKADNNIAEPNWPLAWRQLERAHILGQAYPYQHSEVHWLMLKFGFRIKNTKEILGQIPRLLVGGVKSFVGTIPVGNTGGANVPPLKTMDIPDDLKLLLKTI